MKIIVIGAGFAGLAALKALKKLKRNNEITLFDKNAYTTMIPSLPDLAGDKLQKQYLIEDISNMISPNIVIKKEVVEHVDFDLKTVSTPQGTYHYDYLLISAGSVTNFYGFSSHLENVYKLDSLDEALKIQRDFTQYVNNQKEGHVVFSGAGYTGMELAASLHYLANTLGKDISISMVEMADTILPFLSDKERDYVKAYLDTLSIKVMTKSRVTNFDGHHVTINDEKTIKNVFFIWTAGSTFAINNMQGKTERIRDGRFLVNEFLQVPAYPHVYAAGDSAAIAYEGGYLRKAVNFSIYSGRHAGRNVVRAIREKSLKPFKPIDLGWVIPLHGISMGRVFGRISVKGKIGLRLHYLMSGYRNYNIKNFIAYLKIALTLF